MISLDVTCLDPTFPESKLSLVGLRFNRLVVVEYAGRKLRGHRQGYAYFWKCRCDCGSASTVAEPKLKNGSTKSCGCYQASQLGDRSRTHGQTKSPEFRIWQGMRKRCYNASDPKYGRYGARGIQVCARYRTSFAAFFADMGPRPDSQHSVDRRDNDGHYSCGKCEECQRNEWPANLRWATTKQQIRNYSRNKMFTWQHKTQCLKAWAEELQINYATLYTRIFVAKLSVEEAFSTPVKK